ncbi:DNA excision repair protein ERCC-1 [Entomortierella parvispora]|uniref:DNA excision repair protein ERCC-1 n=1 Tax=Entomortierella parvispora TaxID=205924 RepID=A0A9P3H3C5_9FUNG|nr:DNA excision repair protein ERCC-1 [Entomortierella parvispora]
MNQDSPKDTSAPSGTRIFKLPSKEELEERRRLLEESSKPPLLFKPTGIVANNPNRTGNATNLLNSTATAHGTMPTESATTMAVPSFMSSRLHLIPQQQHQKGAQVGDSPGRDTPLSVSDDEFGFGDLDEAILDDDLFDMDDAASSKSSPSVVSSSATPVSVTSDSATAALVAPPTFVPKSKSTIVVKSSQRGNPLLPFIRNVPYEFGDIAPDYVVGLTSCILFLSIRYHRLHPEYIFNRLAALGKSFVLRIILILVDVDTHQQAIRELTRVSLVNDFTIVCAWSSEEAARYIETFKAYENKAPDAIKERVENDYLSKLTDCLTQVQSINKTDVVTLSSTFGSFKNIMNATTEELGLLPGFGERKVKRLQDAFDQPFAIDPKKRRHRRPA